MTRRRKPAPYVAPRPDPPVVLPPLPWHRDRIAYPQHTPYNVRQLVEGVLAGAFVLPTFQRPYVWTDDQVCRLFDSLIRGYHVGSLILWTQQVQAQTCNLGGVEVAVKAGRARIVVDGQQRLGSIARACLSGRFGVDLMSGTMLVEPKPGPWIVPAPLVVAPMSRDYFERLMTFSPKHVAQWGLDRDVFDTVVCTMADALSCVYLSAVELSDAYSRQEVVEMFRRLNTEGTPMSAEDLDRALTEMDR